MFDFAWSELALIGVVAMVLIGPKDLPVAIKAVKDMVRKARAMAAEFQTHVDDMVRDADLKEFRDTINEVRNFDLKGEIERAVDADGSIRDALSPENLTPVGEHPVSGEVAEAEPGEPEPPPPFIPPQIATKPERPAFIPPNAWEPDIRT